MKREQTQNARAMLHQKLRDFKSNVPLTIVPMLRERTTSVGDERGAFSADELRALCK